MEENKFVLLANFTNEETAEFLSWHKQNKKLPRVIFASVTDTVLQWKVSEWLEELKKRTNTFTKIKNKTDYKRNLFKVLTWIRLSI